MIAPKYRGGERGFTLIELMVVIAIIGMLSSIVLASLAGARAKANDATVKTNLKSVITGAAVYASNNSGTYGPVFTAATCPTSGTSMFYADTGIRDAITAANSAGGAGGTRCATDGTNYAVSVKLRSGNNHWCVDSVSNVKEISNTAWTGVQCP